MAARISRSDSQSSQGATSLRTASSLRTLSQVANYAVAALSCAVLLGWWLDVQTLRSLHPALASMKANTALGLLFLAVGVHAFHAQRIARASRYGTPLLGGLVILLGSFTLWQYASGQNLGIDELLVKDAVSAAQGRSPGRMSQATAALFMLLGLALVLLQLERHALQRSASQWVALLSGSISCFALLGYLYGVHALYAIRAFSTLALHTALAFLLSSLAVLCAQPNRGLMRLVVSDGPGGVLARRLLPGALLLPIGFGWLRLQGERAGLYGFEFGLALFATSNVVCFSFLVYRSGVALQRLDIGRRRMEERLRESELYLSLTLESIGDAVIATDVEGRVVRMNRVAEALTGQRVEEARLLPFAEVFRSVDGETRAPGESPVAKVLRERTVVGLADHTILLAKDGSERAIADSGAPIVDPEGVVRGVVLVFRDVTEEREVRATLERTQARYDRLVSCGIMGVCVFDLAGRILEANPCFALISGYQPAELTSGRIGWSDLTAPGWAEAEQVARHALRERGAVGPFELQWVHQDGKRASLLVGLAMLDEARIIAVVTDMTERKRAEAAKATALTEARAESVGRLRAEKALRETEDQLRQAQKMEAVGRLAGGVAHDFNNLLSVIMSYTSLLLQELVLDEGPRDELEQILLASQRASGLTQQLLAFSRQQVLAPRVIDPNQTIDALRPMLARLIGEDVELLFELGAKGAIHVDPTQLEQVLLNLAVNARDAMPTGGKLTIETADLELDAKYAAEHVDVTSGPYVMLSVSDTGAGMDSATKGRVFEPFFTTKEQGKGTGLGLSTVFGIVKQSGGTVWVYSELGQGSVFKVYLPRVEGEQAAADAPATARQSMGGSETVLLVEDDRQVRELAETILQRNGYRVLVAAAAEQALALSASFTDPIDLLLTDVVMPGSSGRQLAEAFLALRPQMKVLFMSGYTDDAIVRHGVLSSGVSFIQKPLMPEALLAKLRAVLEAT